MVYQNETCDCSDIDNIFTRGFGCALLNSFMKFKITRFKISLQNSNKWTFKGIKCKSSNMSTTIDYCFIKSISRTLNTMNYKFTFKRYLEKSAKFKVRFGNYLKTKKNWSIHSIFFSLSLMFHTNMESFTAGFLEHSFPLVNSSNGNPTILW